MTSFVPDKPGWYWRAHIGSDAQTVSQVIEDLKFHYKANACPPHLFGRDFGYADLYRLDQVEWIAPVTPPDVVDDLVKALEGFLAMYLKAAASGDWGNWNYENDPEVVAARAALQRYRGK